MGRQEIFRQLGTFLYFPGDYLAWEERFVQPFRFLLLPKCVPKMEIITEKVE